MSKTARSSRGTAVQLEPGQPPVSAAPRIGRLVAIDTDGRLFVDFPGNPSRPVAAKLAVPDLGLADVVAEPPGPELLLVFEDNDPARPIIVGIVRDRLPADGIEIHVRGRRFTVETEEEVELRCGDARVRIGRDGKVIVLGKDVVSRARRRHTIKGATVNIN